jgi:hypothetical protein
LKDKIEKKNKNDSIKRKKLEDGIWKKKRKKRDRPCGSTLKALK